MVGAARGHGTSPTTTRRPDRRLVRARGGASSTPGSASSTRPRGRREPHLQQERPATERGQAAAVHGKRDLPDDHDARSFQVPTSMRDVEPGVHTCGCGSSSWTRGADGRTEEKATTARCRAPTVSSARASSSPPSAPGRWSTLWTAPWSSAAWSTGATALAVTWRSTTRGCVGRSSLASRRSIQTSIWRARATSAWPPRATARPVPERRRPRA